MFYERRVSVLYCSIVLIVFMLCARLYNLSKPDTNKSMSVLDGQYTGRIDVCERSGFVYDRNGKLLSHEKAGSVALVNPAECADAGEYAKRISDYAKVSKLSDIYESIQEGKPFTVAVKDEIECDDLEGVYVFNTFCENKNIAKHFMGYNNSDGNGVCGLRKEYDYMLNDKLYSRVYATFESNAKKQSMSPFSLMSEGYDTKDGVVTTIDKDLQMYCDSLKSVIESGAVVLADIKSGEILAMSSFPDYDADNIGNVLNSDKGELVNRVTRSFTPGSVFKIIVSAAALEKDELLWDFEHECTGQVLVGEDVFKCHRNEGHGKQTMEQAFANSCNTYFIKLGQRIGLSAIAETMKKLGLDKSTSADFLEEGDNRFVDKNASSFGYLANISFGQGDLCLSPLDMIKVVCASSCGYDTSLSVIRTVIRNGGYEAEKEKKRERIFSENTCEKILLMMEKCVEEGTGQAAKLSDTKSGGKTATAQTGRFSADGVEYVHKWFCGVYPIEKPTTAVCILLDFSTENGMSPAVIFKNIILFLKEKGF